MTKVNIVIGLLFGDEGKGITTDFLVKQNKYIDYTQIVVRFSGGQQAGHNVRIDDVTHVYSNFGSGALRGVPSYFSEHTTVYPLTMYREYKVLRDKGVQPKMYIHPKANITTPYDIAFNRIRETKKRHGSCGLGVGSTMVRNIESSYKLYAIDLKNINVFNEKLRNIRDYYLKRINEEYIEQFNSIANEEMQYYMNAISRLDFEIKNYDFLNSFDEIIFEGSQGVLLDMDHGFFPNVTYANTTTKNALEICKTLCIPYYLIDIYYVTRCYQTRHGNGWMSNNKEVKLINTEDEINVFNEWQTDFRIGEIDYDLINYAISIDDIYSYDYRKNLVVTCLDQRPDFKFEYNKINSYIEKRYESYSSDSKHFKLIDENSNPGST